MSLPFYSNTVTITPNSQGGDKWEPATPGTPVTGVPCIISNVDPQEVQSVQGGLQLVETVLHVERGVTVNRGDTVTDEDSGDTYEVAWVHVRTDELLGLDRKRCGLIRMEGISG